jgi:PAS domain S-box-containing protein
VVVITGYADVENLNEILDLGAYDYIVKPFHRTEIVRIVRNALSKRECEVKNSAAEEVTERITEVQKEFEQQTRQLRESQVKYKQIVENSNDAIVVAQDGALKFANPKALELTGSTQQEILAIPFVDLIHPDDRAMVEKQRETPVEEGNLATCSFRVLRKTGECVWVEMNSIKTIWEGSQATFKFIRDITERKRAEQVLRDSEERFRRIAELSPFAMCIIDANGQYLYLNRKFTETFGYTLEDIPNGRQWFRQAYPNPAYRRKAISVWKSDMAKEDTHEVKPREFRVRCKNGTLKEILFRPVSMGDGRKFITYEDLTERRRMEEETLKKEKLGSVGILAGGIAHDFNNILGAIVGNISLAKLEAGGESGALGLLEEAEKACARATTLTQQLLTFSKGGTPVKKMASIAEIITESSSFAVRGSKVRCDFSIGDDLWPAEIDVGQISQVIHNLVLNAAQAMPTGGVIEVHAENLLVVEAVHGIPVGPGAYLKISVYDQGVGISEEHMGKIFDPYFTTKRNGSGLGLATAYSIVNRHDGHIAVESETGVGTVFHVYLPASEKAFDDVKEGNARPLVGQGRILVMDDEEMIRSVAKEMLTHIGFEVEVASEGAEAVERYEKARDSGEPFDAVILDLTVPGGMGGEETIEKLLRIDPGVTAIVSSGYFDSPIMSDCRKYGFSGMVTKPYDLGDLSEALNAALKGRTRVNPAPSQSYVIRDSKLPKERSARETGLY